MSELKICPHSQVHFKNEVTNPSCHFCLQHQVEGFRLELSLSEELNRELVKYLDYPHPKGTPGEIKRTELLKQDKGDG